MAQLVQSLNASGLYSTRILLAGTNRAADVAACAVSERLGPLLGPGSPGRYELCRQCCSLCSLRTPRALTRPRFSWQARAMPPMLQLVQSQMGKMQFSTPPESATAVAPQNFDPYLKRANAISHARTTQGYRRADVMLSQ